MRLPNSSEIEKLSKLSELRKRVAMAELAKVARLRDSAKKRIEDLRGKSFSDMSDFDAAALQKWMLWREKEICHRQLELAQAIASYLEAVQRFGRIIAEASVVEDLEKRTHQRERERREKKRQETECTLHFLADNIGNQNI